MKESDVTKQHMPTHRVLRTFEVAAMAPAPPTGRPLETTACAELRWVTKVDFKVLPATKRAALDELMRDEASKL